MANKKKQENHQDPEVAIESAIGRSEAWLQRNAKVLIIALCVIVVIVGGYFAYQYLYKVPQQEKAASAMFQAQDAFAEQEYTLALNGDGNTIGFLQIIDQYGSTASGNLAKHYAGQCYLKEGDYNKAIEFFGKYKNVSGSIPALLVNAVNAGLMGDAYAQSGDMQKAVSQYEKAAKEGADDLTAPYYSRKAGDAYVQLGNYAKALELYKVVKNSYPGSMEAHDIDKVIAQAEQKL